MRTGGRYIEVPICKLDLNILNLSTRHGEATNTKTSKSMLTLIRGDSCLFGIIVQINIFFLGGGRCKYEHIELTKSNSKGQAMNNDEATEL